MPGDKNLSKSIKPLKFSSKNGAADVNFKLKKGLARRRNQKKMESTDQSGESVGPA